MRFGTKQSPLLLLLAPSLVSALSDPIPDTAAGRSSGLSSSSGAGDTSEPAVAVDIDASSRRNYPTKDAPVDGKDGKPHMGPFVGTEPTDGSSSGSSTGGSGSSSSGSTLHTDENRASLKGRPDDYTVVDGKKIPETNDGVMFDKNRERPQEGTTGTEGGVSEKDKTRKAREGQVGGRLQAQPESPKEQPPLPHSEERKLQGSSKDESAKSTYPTDETGGSEYTGLDVSCLVKGSLGRTRSRRED